MSLAELRNSAYGLELRHLRYFMAVAEELHFGHAAERLNLATPALSRAVRQLEEELRVTLFQRNTRSINLTPAGESLLEDAYLILGMADDAARAARNADSSSKHKIRLGVAEMATTGKFACILNAFRVRFPDIQIILTELSTSQQVRALASGAIDVGLLMPPVDSPDLIVENLWQKRYYLAVPSAHLFAQRNEIAVAELESEPLIMPHPKLGSGCYPQILRICRQAGFEPNVVQYMLRRQTMMSMVAANFGLAFVPESFDPADIPGVVFRRFAAPEPRVQTAIVHRRNENSPVIVEFLRMALDGFPQGTATPTLA